MITRRYLMRASMRRFCYGGHRLVQSSSEWARNNALNTFAVGVNVVMARITEDPKYTEMAAASYIDKSTWGFYLNAFRRRLIKSPIDAVGSPEAEQALKQELERLRLKEIDIENAKEYMFNIIFPCAKKELDVVIASQKTLQSFSDMRAPHEWYPHTRLMKRNVIFHGGPTNSGKTYQALKRLAEADPSKGGGIYCGPLRLLALEVYESLNRQGIITDLATGQERRTFPGASHASSTVEMVSTDREFDVAVIDEIQMIGDEDRGHSWTRALLGLRARELHVCGGLEAEKIVRSLMETTGDNYTLVPYQRLSQLEVEETSLLGDYSKVQPGDCIVAFAKHEIFSIKQEIESKTNYRCAVIYGALPSETRSLQARLFNDENTGYDILVASDAIGMGLNLNIRRTIFHTTKKRIGTEVSYLEPTLIKQIAGRAGRLSSNYKVGKVTAWQEIDLAYVRAVMSFDVPEIAAAGIFPSKELIGSFTQQLFELSTEEAKHGIDSSRDTKEIASVPGNSQSPPTDESYSSFSMEEDIQNAKNIDQSMSSDETMSSVDISQASEPAYSGDSDNHSIPPVLTDPAELRLSLVLQKLKDLSQVDKRYFLCDSNSMHIIANWLHSIPLSITDRFVLSTAPVNSLASFAMTALYEYAAKYALNHPVALNVSLHHELPRNLEELTVLCDRLSVLDLYEWLANRFPKNFIERDVCMEQRKFALRQIDTVLRSVTIEGKVSYAASYDSNTRKLKGKLPAKEFPHILEQFQQNLARVPKRFHILLPEIEKYDHKEKRMSRKFTGSKKIVYNNNQPKNHRHNYATKKILTTNSEVASIF